MDKKQMRRCVVKLVMYAVAVVAIFVLLDAIIGRSQVTFSVDWRKALIGTGIFLLVVRVYNWIFNSKSK